LPLTLTSPLPTATSSANFSGTTTCTFIGAPGFAPGLPETHGLWAQRDMLYIQNLAQRGEFAPILRR
jgi:hypothetical protein